MSDGNALVVAQERRLTLASQAKAQREALQDTLQQLDSRLGGTVDKVSGLADQAQEGLQSADGFIRKHRWAFVAGGVALGVALGRKKPAPIAPDAPGVTSSLFSTFATLAARQAAKALVDQLVAPKTPDEDKPAETVEASTSAEKRR